MTSAEDADRGLASERTALAWERTALSLLGAAALLATAVVRHPRGWVVLPIVVALVGAAVLAWSHARRPRRRPLAWLSAATVLAAVGAAGVTVLGLR